MNKLISIVGPTASGKTALGIYLAKKFNGEIVSADSRQVYKYMDIGTAKDLDEYGNVKYHCIDIVDPKTSYNLSKYTKRAHKEINEIIKNKKVPFLVGGTGLYINSVTQNYNLKNEEIDENLRKELNSKSKIDLQKMVNDICKKSSVKMPLNNSDFNNPHRLIRFIEKNKDGYVIDNKNNLLYENLIIGIRQPKDLIAKKILERLDLRLEKQDMIKEVWDLHYKYNVSWKRILSFGLEYEGIGEFLFKNKKEIIKNKNKFDNAYLMLNFNDDYKKMRNFIYMESVKYVKRQLTWFEKNKNIIWVDGEKSDIINKADKLVTQFLK